TLRTARSGRAPRRAARARSDRLAAPHPDRPRLDLPTRRRMQARLCEGIDGYVSGEETIEHACERGDAGAFEGAVVEDHVDLEAAAVAHGARDRHASDHGPIAHGAHALDLA